MAGSTRIEPNLLDYPSVRDSFTWEACRSELDGLPNDAGLNIAYEAVDRHAAGARREHLALRWLGKKGEVRDYSYGRLAEESSRFANLLEALGVQNGERVFGLAGRIPELHVAVLGTLKRGAVFCPLFSAFGPEPILHRLRLGGAKVVVTTPQLYRTKLAKLRDQLPDLKHVLLVGGESKSEQGLWSLEELMRQASPSYEIAPTDPEQPALLHFTSGTTGMPKGALHVHRAVLTHYITGKYVLDFHPEDRFWCTADPGWVTGTSYGIIAPYLHGVTNILDEGDFEAHRWYELLQAQQVSVWYTAPTAIRMLMRLDIDPLKEYGLTRLRLIHSVGEPLNPEAVLWARKTLGMPIHDNWWQSETGGIMIANFPSLEIRPGSMGKPLPGVAAAVARRTEEKVEVLPDGEEGELVLKAGWPSMFRSYLNEPERYAKCFHDGWYFTGDLAKRDSDGYFWFVGRSDDVIKTAGHLVSPFEVESAMLEHAAVAEAAVIGKPEPTIGQIVKVFVSLKPGREESEELRLELLGFARKRLGSAVAPKELSFLPQLPKTRSGKIMRRLLRARELGLPEGDTSTLEVM